MKWITRERPKIDRIACPWLILRFIDHDAEFLGCKAKWHVWVDLAALQLFKGLKAAPFLEDAFTFANNEGEEILSIFDCVSIQSIELFLQAIELGERGRAERILEFVVLADRAENGRRA